MAVITPLLDTLLHDVLGKRMDRLNPREAPESVRPVSPQDALSALRSDSRLQSGQSPAAVDAGRQQLRAGGTPAQPGSLLNSQLSGQPTENAGSVRFNFSPVGRVIAELLQRFPEGPAVVRPTGPLMNPGALPQEVAGRLQLSITESGLFYESHLSRWSRGHYPLTSLQREPQAQMLLFASPQSARAGATATTAAGTLATTAGTTFASSAAPLSTTTPIATAATPTAGSTVTGSTEAASQPRLDVPPEPRLMNNEQLQSLVRQQLELLATPIVRWEGDVWSGLFMALMVHVPPVMQQAQHQQQKSDSEEDGDTEDTAHWHSELNLEVSGLGSLGIDIRLGQENLLLTVRAEATVIDCLEQGREALLARLAATGLPATTLQFEAHGHE